MLKRALLTAGKTKWVYITDDPSVLIMRAKKTITAHDNPDLTKEFPAKAWTSTQTTCNVFALLRSAGIPVAYRGRVSQEEFAADAVDMLPMEVIIRRWAVGSKLKRNPELIRPKGEKPHRFPRLCVEFDLKTTQGRYITRRGQTIDLCLNYMEGEEDPIIADIHSDVWVLHHTKKPLSEETILGSVARDAVLENPGHVAEMEELARKVFLILEKVWGVLGYTLIDLKIEFGVSPDGRLLVADVIDNDSWRLWDPDGKELSKQVFRDEGLNSAVVRNYRLIAELSNLLRLPDQAVIYWRGDAKSDFADDDEVRTWVEGIPGITVEYLTGLPDSELPSQLVAKFRDGGVVITSGWDIEQAIVDDTVWPVVETSAQAITILAQANPAAYCDRQYFAEDGMYISANWTLNLANK